MSRVPGNAPALAPAEPRAVPMVPWPVRALDTVSTYLPLLLMALLALGTWWLVENTPLFEAPRPAIAPRHEPDYTMRQFMIQRFDANGVMRAQLEGDVLRHYPDNDTTEIDNPRIRAIGLDGRVTIATAKRALANADGSEVQLMVGARVLRQAVAKEPEIEFRGEFLHAFLNTERVRSHLPVVITQGGTELRAATLDYDNLARVVQFSGRSRATFATPPKTPKR